MNTDVSEMCSFLRSWAETMGYEGFSQAADRLEELTEALRGLVRYCDGEQGDDFGTAEWAAAREALGDKS